MAARTGCLPTSTPSARFSFVDMRDASATSASTTATSGSGSKRRATRSSNVVDIAALTAIARDAKCRDDCRQYVPLSYLQRPLELGVDVIDHEILERPPTWSAAALSPGSRTPNGSPTWSTRSASRAPPLMPGWCCAASKPWHPGCRPMNWGAMAVAGHARTSGGRACLLPGTCQPSAPRTGQAPAKRIGGMVTFDVCGGRNGRPFAASLRHQASSPWPNRSLAESNRWSPFPSP